ncbi:MAG: protein TolQ [Thermodesulfovibrionales bacterium]|nr:protein TolQ [Thermodesulfovibrionales bacterium]
MKHTVIGLILGATPVVKAVMLILFIFSILSWFIIFYKFKYFRQAKKENEEFIKAFMKKGEPLQLFQLSRKLRVSPIAGVFRNVFNEEGYASKTELERNIKRYEALEIARLEQYLNFLATAGSTSPFIGLFGTVWGIMHSFMGIGAQGSASLAVVAPGIAEALIATALGLLVAIPAVIAYNYYLSMARKLTIEMEDFSEEILELLSNISTESQMPGHKSRGSL